MKKLKYLGVLIIAIISLNSCTTDDSIVFIAQEPAGFSFTNSFLSEYTLTPAGADNLGERFTWTNADFDVPTNITYELQKSLIGDFSDAAVVASTSGNELVVTISQLLAMAADAGLDNDPNTSEPDTGNLYFRLRAFAGASGSSTDVFTDAQTLTVILPEIITGPNIQVSTWGVVGSGYNNWGAFADGAFYTTDQPNVLVSYVTLLDGEIKFRENNDWANNFGDDGADGTLDAGGENIVSTAGHYKIVLDLNNNTYTIEQFSWGVVGSSWNDWGNDGPDAKFFYDYTTDTFKLGVKLLAGEMKFRKNNDWAENFGDTGADGTLDAGGDNIVSTAGYYAITLDLNNNAYTIEAADLFGIVGSGYNDWGNGGPDFTFTEVNPGIWIAEIVTIVDGEIKFRVNEDWAINFGDTGADGTLDDAGDNIAVTAGNYRIFMNMNDNTYSINN